MNIFLFNLQKRLVNECLSQNKNSNSYHVLKGEPELARASASFKSIMKAIKNEGQGFFLEYQNLAKEEVHDTPPAKLGKCGLE